MKAALPRSPRDTAELPTAEPVANAVEHTTAGAPIELVVETRAGGCQVEVHDGDPRPPGELTARPYEEHPDPWQEHGRGLVPLRALSTACGHRPIERGKAVRFTLPAAAAAAGPRGARHERPV
ncbi:ATP-binding protein [Streptomyces sp. NPDC001389]|uniref:ATP-binding protein n=1 Tax=Streptomyces sp. NPDC001389 TaxID=3364569 RepID=UPI00369E1DE5